MVIARRGLLGARGFVAVAAVAAVAAAGACGGSDEPQGPAEDTAAAAAPATSATPCAASAGDEVSANQIARTCGSRVEVESGRTEYAQVYVEPSGSRTIEATIAPQRAQRRDGTWGPIDTTLQRVGDLLAPTATAANVRFSTGGAGPFVTLTRDGHSFALSWPAPLPAPMVSGDSATYAEVLPDVDLVVKATDTGFTHLLVVKSARAAANPQVRHAKYRIGGDARLTPTPDGGLIAEVDGVRVASAEPPAMWDTATAAGVRPLALSSTAGAAARTARVASAIANGHIELTPDLAMLTDPAARFPLVIDPLYVAGENQWAYASADNQNGPTTDSTIAAGDPSPAAACLRVGNDPDTSHQYRSFMRFSIAPVAGKQILTAKIAGRVDHTWKCGSNRPTYFYRSAGIAATPRQAWPGPALQLLLGNNNVHANEASCNEPNMPFEVSTGTLINDLQASANAGASSYFIAISAGENTGGLNETNTERWMRYFLADFKLHITYNTKPAMPDGLTVDGKPCASGANRPFVKTTTPTLRAHVSDADGDSLDVWFAWAKWNGSSFVDEPGGGLQGSVPSGGTALFNVTGNVDGGIYTFRSQSNDSPSHSPSLASDVTNVPGNCEWQVDISPPAAPTVTSDVYPEGPAACGGGACGAVGRTGRFTFSSSPDTKAFLWGFSDPPTTPVTPDTLGGSVTISWTPASSGPRTLFVRAIDRAGNESNTIYPFNVAAELTALARWRLDEAAGATQLADDTGNGSSLALVAGTLGAPGRIVPGRDGAPRTGMQVDGSGDGAASTAPVLADTSQSFSVAAWVKLTDGSATRHVISQGGDNPAFMLEYSLGTGVWKLTAPSADGASFPGPAATSVPRLGTWTHLAGSYDAATHEMRIYVNGALEGTAAGVTVRAGGGPLRIGHLWAGSLGEVQVWNRVISAAEVFDLSDPLQVGRVGEWHMDEVGPGPAFDASALAHDLTFYNGAVIPAAGAGQTGTGLRLDGVDDYAAPDGPVLHTDQSFTISAWVRPSSAIGQQTFVSQASAGSVGGFSLKYGDDAGGHWKLRMYASATDTDPTHTTFASAPAVGVTTAFHHLVGVFDAQNRELRLHVDGVLGATAALNPAWQPWDAAGPLLIGRHHNTGSGSEFTAGDIDEVRVYQGAVTDVTRIP
ncbi:MAG TPA: LamG domain-containing protein [Kofleriaceae bacterium]|jgi:hypothetical protein